MAIYISAAVVRDQRQYKLVPHTYRLVSSEVVWSSLKAIMQMNIDTIGLVKEVQEMDHLIGSI